MDYLCENYPMESIWFFKRAIQMTVITGISLIIPTATCIYATWDSPDGSDRSLRYWSVFRVLIFLVQIPLRYRIWRMLHLVGMEARRNSNEMFEISDKLSKILETKEWKLTQYFSGLLSAWVGVTLAITFLMETHFPDTRREFACYRGYLSPCLYRLCWVSIGILCVHVAFVFLWLRNVLNSNCGKNDCITGITPLLLRQVSTIVLFDGTDGSNKSVAHETCSICLENYQKNDEIRIFDYCNHDYHKECIGQWLNKQTRCPLCNHCILDGYNDIKKYNNDINYYRNAIRNELEWESMDNDNSDNIDNNDNSNNTNNNDNNDNTDNNENMNDSDIENENNGVSCDSGEMRNESGLSLRSTRMGLGSMDNDVSPRTPNTPLRATWAYVRLSQN